MNIGFSGRRSPENAQLPPGQYLTTDFPVLSAGHTPHLRRWDWTSFRELPSETFTVDLHCVTRWSKLGTSWEGVSLDTILADVLDDSYALAHSYAFRFDSKDLSAEHGGPARLLVPHLYLWKSAKWVRGITLMRADKPDFWEGLGYHNYGDPWREQRYSGDE